MDEFNNINNHFTAFQRSLPIFASDYIKSFFELELHDQSKHKGCGIHLLKRKQAYNLLCHAGLINVPSDKCSDRILGTHYKQYVQENIWRGIDNALILIIYR